MTSPDLIMSNLVEKVAQAIYEGAHEIQRGVTYAQEVHISPDAETLKRAARAAIAVVLEEAAKIAESCHPAYPQTQAGRDNYDACDIIAKHIRSRLTKEST